MQKTLRVQTQVSKGGRIEIDAANFAPGETVEVIVTVAEEHEMYHAADIFAEMTGQHIFRTAADVARYLDEERRAWDR